MIRAAIQLAKTALAEFLEDQALTQAAATAFYSILSLAPLLLLLFWLVGLVDPQAESAITGRLSEELGPQAGRVVGLVLRNARAEPGFSSVSSVVSLIVLLFAATAVFAQLQAALNQMWEVAPKPEFRLGIWIKRRLMTFLMVFILGGLLLAATVTSWILRAAFPESTLFSRLLDSGVSLALFAVLFALLFRYLPDAVTEWPDVWLGAAVTAVLFGIGRWALGLYFQYSPLASAYGAAGSIIVLIVMVYYSSLILFFGAELTQVYARRHGEHIRPRAYARWTAAHAPQPG